MLIVAKYIFWMIDGSIEICCTGVENKLYLSHRQVPDTVFMQENLSINILHFPSFFFDKFSIPSV